MSDGERILQIMPADDWYAEFTDEDGDEVRKPVVCFALTEVTADGATSTQVRPMVWVDEATAFCDDVEGFEGVVRGDEIDDDDDDDEDDDEDGAR